MKQLSFVQDKAIEKFLEIETELISVIDIPLKELRKEIQSRKGLIIVQGGDLDINRFVVENKKVDILLSPENNSRKDLMFSRRSGLNQVLCKLAAKNGVAIGFDFSYLLNSKGKQRARILGRMRQNVKFCKKYGVKMVFSSFARNKYELRSEDFLKIFARILGKF
jgi:ribonuclease P/MRP protein subunit RPP1